MKASRKAHAVAESRWLENEDNKSEKSKIDTADIPSARLKEILPKTGVI